MQKIIVTFHEELQSRFWSVFQENITLFDTQEEIFVGLSGGSSLDIFYEYIRHHFGEISEAIRTKIRWCLLDERIVTSDHVDSNIRQLREKFLDELVKNDLIQEDQIISVFPPPAKMEGSRNLDCHVHHPQIQDDSSQGQLRYADDYSNRVPRIDIALVGVGPDGHIASLFPRHPLLENRTHGYLEITDSPKPPAHRITTSRSMIESASYAFVSFMRGKEEIFRLFQDFDTMVFDCPVKMLLQCENLVVMSDIDE